MDRSGAITTFSAESGRRSVGPSNPASRSTSSDASRRGSVSPRKYDGEKCCQINISTTPRSSAPIPIKKTEPKKSAKKAETSDFKTVDQATADNADVDAPADTEVVEPQAVTEAIDESAADVAEKAATDQAKKDATQA